MVHLIEIHFIYFVLSLKNTMSQSLLFDIDFLGSYRPFHSKKLQLIKIQNMCICSYYFNFLVFQYMNNIPIPILSTKSSTSHFDYLYARIYQLNVKELVAESFIFQFTCKQQKMQKASFHTLHRILSNYYVTTL